MAQYLAGTAVGPGAVYDFIQQLLAHMVTNGWTQLYVQNSVHDVGYDVWMQGGALDATADNRPIIRITWTTTTRVTFRCYADWDPVAHVGILEGGSPSYSYIDLTDATFAFWLKVNPIAFAYVAKNGGSYNHSYAGFLRRGFAAGRSGITKTTTALAIGATSIPTASSMVGKIMNGQKIHIFNYSHSDSSPNKLNGEMVTVTSVTAGSIGCSALTKAYDSGALVGENPYPCLVAGASVTGQPTSSQIFYPRYLDGSPISGTNLGANFIGTTSYPAATSPSYTQDYPPAIISFYSNVTNKGGFLGYPYHYEGCAQGVQSAEDFANDGTFTYLVIGNYSNVCLLLGPREE